jgi:hypothetical protein
MLVSNIFVEICFYGRQILGHFFCSTYFMLYFKQQRLQMQKFSFKLSKCFLVINNQYTSLCRELY